MLISADGSACHGSCIRRKLASIDVETVLVLSECDNEVRCTLLQRPNVDWLVTRRAAIDSVRLSRRRFWTGLHLFCPYHLRMLIAVRTSVCTKRTQSPVCSASRSRDDCLHSSRR